jgi:putative holliday junction resolvase
VNPAPPFSRLAAPSASAALKILAIDYGRARIGLAIAESLQGVAQPLGTLARINRNEDMRRLRELVRDHAVTLILVGLPLRLDGSHGDMAEETERFAQRLRKQVGVAVEMADERLTSWEAERLLEEEFGRKSKQIDGAIKKKDVEKFTVDSVAATIILREYLERANHASPEAG